MSDDFVTNGFGIAHEEGFDDGAMHTIHPYTNASVPGKDTTLYFELKHTIVVSNANPVIEFDEVLLAFDPAFVEIYHVKSKQWITLESYTSFSNSHWFSFANSQTSGSNSLAIGNKSLLKKRSVSLTVNPIVQPGDEVKLRFRLQINHVAFAWGWAIDNLLVQPDISAPVIYHYHYDYLKPPLDELFLSAIIIDDFSFFPSAYVDYRTSAVDEWRSIIMTPGFYYSVILDLRARTLQQDDTLFYKIRSVDQWGNESSIPEWGSFAVIVKDFMEPVTSYFNDFEEKNVDFVGNAFFVGPLFGYPNRLAQTLHPHPKGFGENVLRYSIFTYNLMRPVIVSEDNASMTFDEALFIEWEVFRDFVGVEASKDGGVSWVELGEYYSSRGTVWQDKVSATTVPSPSLFRRKYYDIANNFSPGDTIILRFAMYVDNEVENWGWAIDNVSIQSTITSIERSVEDVRIYPNPANDQIFVEAPGEFEYHEIEILNGHGAVLTTGRVRNSVAKIEVANLPSGVYWLRWKAVARLPAKRILIVH